jgi:hypothetical protein
MKARSAEVELELRQLRLGNGARFDYQVRATAALAIRQAWLTEPTRAPCTGGSKAVAIQVDGRDSVSVPPGTHELGVEFEGAATKLNLVMDLGLGDGGCARAPALSQSLPMKAASRFALLGTVDVVAGQDLRGLAGVVGGRLGAGAWLGPVMLGVEAGVGSALCNVSTCGEGEGGQVESRVTFPVSLNAIYSFPAWLLPNGLSAWRLGAAYTFLPVRVPALTGERRFAVHGVHVMPGWAMGPLAAGPFVDAHRTLNMEIYLPVGVFVDSGGPSRKVGFSAGAVIRFLVPL